MKNSIDYTRLACGSQVYCGLLVCRTDDPRHVGRVEAIHATMTVTVKWENGWKELIDYRELTKANNF